MKKVLVLLAMFGFALQANATYWYEFAHKSYVDLDSLKKSQNMVFVWAKLLNDGNISPIENKKVWYTLNTMYIDLKNKKIAVKDLYYYDLNNERIEKISSEKLDWNIVIPDSLAESLYEVVEKYPRFEKAIDEELWVDIDEQTKLDVYSLLMTNSECCNMWLKVYKKKLKTPNTKSGFVKAFLSVNLVENTMAVIETIEYNKKGEIVKINKFNDLIYEKDNDGSIKPIVDYIINLDKLLEQKNNL